jgi:prepilin-type N-terminal cleavage/methylation domain-containing protein
MKAKLKKSAQAGFSLIEVTISILILVIVMGAVFAQVNRVTQTSKREAVSLDLVDENRDFVDLFVRDIHMAGYPVKTIYSNPPSVSCDPVVPAISLPTCGKSIAVGIVSASPTSLRLEGDIYGDGNVYSVLYTYFAAVANDSNCPCVRRSAVQKQNGDPILGQGNPLYYTEVQNVIDPANMVQPIFTYFNAAGQQINVGGGVNFEANAAVIQQIDAIKVNLNVRSQQIDSTGHATVNSLTSIAELEN